MEKTRAQIRGVLNKATVSTATTVCAPLLQTYTTGDPCSGVSSHDLTQAIGSTIVESLTTQSNVRLRGGMVLPHCILAKSIQMAVGNHHAAYLLKAACESLQKILEQGASDELTNNGLHNLSMYLAMLYAVGLLDAVFVSSLCTFLANGVAQETYCSALLTIMQHGGETLRRDSATVVQDVLRIVQRWSESEGMGVSGTRHATLLDFLRELRFFHKRKKTQSHSFVVSAEELDLAREAIKKLGPSATDGRDTVLSVTWDQCIHAADARWWLPAIPEYQFSHQATEDAEAPLPSRLEIRPMAANNQINTPLRRDLWALFSKKCLLSAQHVMERISHLDPKESQAYEIAFVMSRVLETAEAAPIVTAQSPIVDVTHKLCATRRDFRHNMQIVVLRMWDGILESQTLHLPTLVATAQWSAILLFHQRLVTKGKSTLVTKIPKSGLGQDGSSQHIYYLLFFMAVFMLCTSEKDVLDCFVAAAPHDLLAKFFRENFVKAQPFSVFLPVMAPGKDTSETALEFRRKANLVQKLLKA